MERGTNLWGARISMLRALARLPPAPPLHALGSDMTLIGVMGHALVFLGDGGGGWGRLDRAGCGGDI